MTVDSSLKDPIVSGARAMRVSLTDGQANQLVALIESLERWNRRINLTAIRKKEDMVSGHVLDSLAVRPFLHGDSVLDIGTGAGFPGLPLAIVAPDIRFVLLDSNGKKISFVREMIGMLGLENAEAVKARAEDYAPEAGFDTVIARALATVPRLVDLGGHLVGEGGRLLALKGKHPAQELETLDSGWKYDVTELAVPGLPAHERHVVALHRNETETR